MFPKGKRKLWNELSPLQLAALASRLEMAEPRGKISQEFSQKQKHGSHLLLIERFMQFGVNVSGNLSQLLEAPQWNALPLLRINPKAGFFPFLFQCYVQNEKNLKNSREKRKLISTHSNVSYLPVYPPAYLYQWVFLLCITFTFSAQNAYSPILTAQAAGHHFI